MQEENTLLKDANVVYRGIKSGCALLLFILSLLIIVIVVYAVFFL